MTEPAIRVLLVDDDEDEYVIIGHLLRVSGSDRFDLTWVPDYEQGLKVIRDSGCDVCLVDYRLGQLTGLDLLAEMTGGPDYPPVILLTGEGSRQVDEAAAKAGAADYLVKGELLAAVLERSIRYSIELGRTFKALKDARQLAENLNLAKSSFLAAMSHEIRTPMNAILGMADMLWESPLNPEQKQYVEVFRRAGSGLLLLTNDILDLSKIDLGRLQLERVAFDIEDVVKHAIELTEFKARANGLALESHIAPDVITAVMGDPGRLRQVLMNLLGNAIKFTSSGKIILTVEVSANPGQIEFAVSDTGIGIAPGKLETIFEDYEQAEPSTTRDYGGTGLGLGISRRLVEAMGGLLTAASSIGSGSTFRFNLALDQAPEKHPTSEVPTPESIKKPAPKPARILIAEDSPDSRLLIRAYLKDSPHQITFEENGKAAVDRFAASEFDLILMDLQMPVMDGFTATSTIRAFERDRGSAAIPIVALSASATVQDVGRCSNAGCNALLSKPVSKAQLLNAIQEYGRQPEPAPVAT